MEMTYQVLIRRDQLAAIYRRLADEGLLWAVWSDIDGEQWSEDFFVSMLDRPEMLVLGGYVDGALAGVMTLNPLIQRTRTLEIGLTAFRDYFGQAEALCRGALLWACETQDVASFLGRVAAPNRHILRMLGRLGFRELGRVPGLGWYTRKQDFVEGVLVLATPASIRATKGQED